MPPVLISCPVTGDLVPTGVEADDAEGIEHLPDDNLLIACPECGRDHEWKPQDAVVASG
jgi:hypothetical protein